MTYQQAKKVAVGAIIKRRGGGLKYVVTAISFRNSHASIYKTFSDKRVSMVTKQHIRFHCQSIDYPDIISIIEHKEAILV